ncbi:MAG: ABC transporter ATP-binding protein [Sneathiella sp.]
MIELIKVTKSYNLKGVRKSILHDVSFRFPHDRNVAVLGDNGAGKSTLLRLIAGTEMPDSGQIYRTSRVSWPLGFAGGFNGTMTGIENIRFVARIYGEDTEDVIEYVREFAELGSSIALPIKTYSSGMKARLAFGLSMAINFDCYLVDEIIAVGDPNFKRKSRNVFSSKLANAQIIMVSHSTAQIRDFCNCGVYLVDGRVYFYDDVGELIGDYEAGNKMHRPIDAN